MMGSLENTWGGISNSAEEVSGFRAGYPIPYLENFGRLSNPVTQNSTPSRHPEFQAAPILAIFLDAALSSPGHGPPIRSMGVDSSGLAEAIQSLSTAEREALSGQLGAGVLAELSSLSEETDPLIFYQDVFTLGRRMASEGKGSLASGLLQISLSSIEGLPPTLRSELGNLRERINQEVGAMEGTGGPWGLRLEYMLDHFVQQVADPINLAGFAVAAGSFNLARFGILSRTMATSGRSSLTGLLGNRLLAFSGGVATESAAFTLSTKGLRHLTGHNQDWSGETLGREMLSMGITMGFLRSSGVISRGIFNKIHGIQPLSPTMPQISLGRFSQVSKVLIPQASMLGGIYLAHQTESALGLRPEAHGAQMALESLVTLLHFNVAGRLFESFQPARFRNFNHTLEVQSQKMFQSAFRRSRGIFNFPPGRFHQGGLVPVSAEGNRFPIGERPSYLDLLSFMTGKKDGNSNPSPSGGTRIQEGTRDIPPNRYSLLEEHPMPTLVTNESGEIVFLNRAASQVLSSGAQLLIGRPISEIFVSREGSPGLVRPILQGGSNLFLEKESRPFPGEPGLDLHYLNDITELMLTRARDQVCETCAYVPKAKIADTLRMMNHDVNNYLHFLVTFSHFTLPRLAQIYDRYGRFMDTPEEFSTNMEFAREAGSIIDEVQFFMMTSNRLLSGRKVPMKAFDLSETVTSVLRTPSLLRRPNEISIQSELEPGIIFHGNRPLIRSALGNLIKNSMEAMPDGGTIRIESRKSEEGVVIEVSDTGTGIPPDSQGRIFDIDFTTKQEGHGLGLSMVRKIIETIHNGNIQIISSTDQGTTLQLSLPNPG